MRAVTAKASDEVDGGPADIPELLQHLSICGERFSSEEEDDQYIQMRGN